MSEELIDDMKKLERTFLHDLSNPLAIVFANIRMASMKLEADVANADTVKEKLQKALKTFDRINALLEERRDLIKK